MSKGYVGWDCVIRVVEELRQRHNRFGQEVFYEIPKVESREMMRIRRPGLLGLLGSAEERLGPPDAFTSQRRHGNWPREHNHFPLTSEIDLLHSILKRISLWPKPYSFSSYWRPSSHYSPWRHSTHPLIGPTTCVNSFMSPSHFQIWIIFFVSSITAQSNIQVPIPTHKAWKVSRTKVKESACLMTSEVRNG